MQCFVSIDVEYKCLVGKSAEFAILPSIFLKKAGSKVLLTDQKPFKAFHHEIFSEKSSFFHLHSVVKFLICDQDALKSGNSVSIFFPRFHKLLPLSSSDCLKVA